MPPNNLLPACQSSQAFSLLSCLKSFTVGLLLFASPSLADTNIYGLNITGITSRSLGNGMTTVIWEGSEVIKSDTDARRWIISQGFSDNLIKFSNPLGEMTKFILAAEKNDDFDVAGLALCYLMSMSATRPDWLLVAENLNTLSENTRKSFKQNSAVIGYTKWLNSTPLLVALKLPYPESLGQNVADEIKLTLDSSDSESLPKLLSEYRTYVRSPELRESLNVAKDIYEAISADPLNEQTVTQFLRQLEQQPDSTDFLLPVLQARLISLMNRGVFSDQESLQLLIGWPPTRITPEIKERVETVLQRDSLPYRWVIDLTEERRSQLLTAPWITTTVKNTALEKSFTEALKQQDFSGAENILGYLGSLQPVDRSVNDRLVFALAKEFILNGYERMGWETLQPIQARLTWSEKFWLYRFWITVSVLLVIISVSATILIRRKLLKSSTLITDRKLQETKTSKITGDEPQPEVMTDLASEDAAARATAEPLDDEGQSKANTKSDNRSFVQLDPNRHLVAVRNEYVECLHVLGLRENASLSEIKRAYRERMKDLHPDLQASGDSKASATFMRVNQAYETSLVLRKQLFAE